MSDTAVASGIRLPVGSFAFDRRLAFVAQTVRARGGTRVLDVGCGTGLLLTMPLADACPDASFLGIDDDRISIDFARRRNRAGNLFFATAAPAGEQFDIVVASEVIEHVDDPDAFLNFLKARLAPDGRLVLTLPNGYGPSEIASFVEASVRLVGLFGVLRFVYRCLRLIASGRWTAQRPAVVDDGPIDTLADSPHLSFFTWREIHRRFARAGLAVERYQPRMFLCGFGLSNLVDGAGLADWNARVVDCLPPSLASDWMFVLRPAEPRAVPPFRRGWLSRFRRRINEKRWGVAR